MNTKQVSLVDRKFKKVVIFSGISQYGTVTDRIKGLAKGFEINGLESVVLEANHWDEYKALNPNEVAFFLCPQGWKPAEKLPRPMIALFGDHPIYHLPRIKPLINDDCVICFPYPNFIHFTSKVFPKLNTQLVPPSAADKKPTVFKDKNMDVVVMGSLVGEERTKFHPQLPNWLKTLGKKTITRLKEGDVAAITTLYQQAQAQFKAKAPQVDANMREQLIAHTAITADLYWRRKLRISYLEAMTHLPLTVFGEGWKQVIPTDKDIIQFRQPLPYQKALEAYQDAKMVLNLFPAGYSFHERLFDSFAASSVPITFWTKDAAAFFDVRTLTCKLGHTAKEAAHNIQTALDKPAQLAQSALDGNHWLNSNWTDAHRSQAYITIAQKAGWI